MKKIKLLFVEDDPAFSFLTKGTLEIDGLYEVCHARNGEEGLKFYESFHPDIIVSDIEMPVMDGMKMVKAIRQKDRSTPIILATGLTSSQDVMAGFELGIDNFVKKPFIPKELDMYIQAAMKRIQPLKVESVEDTVLLGEYVFNPNARILQIKGQPRRLTDKETKILWILYTHRGNIAGRDLVLEEVWGIDDYFTSRSLDVFISNLRKYLSEDPRISIQTIRAKGFRLMLPD